MGGGGGGCRCCRWPLRSSQCDDPAKARPFLKRNGSIFPTLLDPDGRTSIDYGVAGVPETFVIRADGTIARKFTGPVSFGELAAVLEPLL